MKYYEDNAIFFFFSQCLYKRLYCTFCWHHDVLFCRYLCRKFTCGTWLQYVPFVEPSKNTFSHVNLLFVDPLYESNTRQSLLYVDKTIGFFIDQLEDQGWLENSVIVFASDNGGCSANGGTSYPLRGGKQSMFEGGTRVGRLDLFLCRFFLGNFFHQHIKRIRWNELDKKKSKFFAYKSAWACFSMYPGLSLLIRRILPPPPVDKYEQLVYSSRKWKVVHLSFRMRGHMK